MARVVRSSRPMAWQLRAVVGGWILAGLLICSASAEAQQLGGPWQGRWQSRSTGHRGPLAATFQATGPNTYQANFRGRFAGIIPFRYSVPLTVVQSGPVEVLSGQSRLPLFGTFRYTAVSDGRTFTANYSSRRDQGVFLLARP